jgi:carboxylate-amine ligase
MSKLIFNANERPSLGVELELGLVDGETMDLANAAGQVLDCLPDSVRRFAKPELMQSCVEVITDVCDSVGHAEKDLRGKLVSLQQATDSLGLCLWWGATHPNSDWRDQAVTEDERYLGLVDLLQEMARRLITFGLHVHVGVDSGDKAVMICDRMMQHLPTLLALTASSPYWERRDTGLHSHRSKIMEGLPTAGLPTLMRNWSEYVWLVNHMVETGFINSIREIWWDIRPHHNFGTVEVRVCDMPGNLDHVLGVTALVQCLVKALSDEIDQGAYQHDCHPMMVRQNKWRACRYGTGAQLVNTATYEVQSVSEVVCWLIERLGPIADQLGCRERLESVQAIADNPAWADRQRQILKETGKRSEIVRQLSAESRLS